MNGIDLKTFAKMSINKGSRSFAFASLFFKSETKLASHLLYAWCRYADDMIDLESNTETAHARWLELKKELDMTFDDSVETPSLRNELIGIRYIQKKYELSPVLFYDILEGFQMDLRRPIVKSQTDLDRYCYCVAGAVGILMNHIMTHQPSAEADVAACELGLAMQKTNILRDFFEDAGRGRCYIPETELHKNGLDSETFLKLSLSEKNFIFAQFAEELFSQAEFHYLKARKGYHSLPWRARLAVRMAASIYREIGVQVLKQRDRLWEQRVYTRWWTKVRLAFKEFTLQLQETKRIA